ncbi:hypothetical protein Mgra_00009135 [Meloidogyne graminicola]|nr:hypothetical protein Mgra_00009135 [Meloidogyne graminicola]KAF7629859.1 hypothetical protein Mgra_00009135 [Meloidogyne graminicola]
MLFVPGRNTPFVKVPLKFLEAPFKIGQFYSIKLPNVKQSKYTSIYYNNFAKIWKETPPIKTRISSGTIQFHICALLDKRTENGFSCFKSKNFPLVIDSSCLFNHYNINGKMSIKKVKFWCSLRKIPIAGIYWKIVKIDKKFKKEIISFIDERQNEEEKLKRKKEEEVKKKEEIKKKLEKEKIQQIIKQQQQQKTIKEKIAKNENECFNGFVCAQLLNEYIIYLPEEKEYAYLLIKSKMDKLLGLWLQIQIRYLNEKLMVERFFVVESKILSIVSNKRAMFKSKIEIPSLNDPTETLPFCTTLGIYLNDNHNLIQNKHRGRCVNGTIGVKPLENEESLIQWEILHIMEH